MTALYEIAAQYRADAALLADLDIDEQTLADTLEGLIGALEVKAQNVVFATRNLEAAAEAIKDAEEKMATRRRAIENRAASLRRYVLASMQAAGVSKIECPYFRVAVQDNPPAVDVYEPGMIPAAYLRAPEPPPPAVDKKALAGVLKAGHAVPGARLVRSQRLVVA